MKKVLYFACFIAIQTQCAIPTKSKPDSPSNHMASSHADAPAHHTAATKHTTATSSNSLPAELQSTLAHMSSSSTTPEQVLGLSANFTPQELDAAYKSALNKYHASTIEKQVAHLSTSEQLAAINSANAISAKVFDAYQTLQKSSGHTATTHSSPAPAVHHTATTEHAAVAHKPEHQATDDDTATAHHLEKMQEHTQTITAAFYKLLEALKNFANSLMYNS